MSGGALTFCLYEKAAFYWLFPTFYFVDSVFSNLAKNLPYLGWFTCCMVD